MAGVSAGSIADIRLDRRTKRALVDIELNDDGFGDLRADATCEVRPQSLLGEYFLNCLPGEDRRRLDEGATVPVERTSATIPADLVTNVLRRPYAERLRLIINELGAGVAGNGESLNAALRRAVPAMRETEAVLSSLASQERALENLADDADTVLGELARHRRDVGRFVVDAGEAAAATAPRDRELSESFRRLPAFLDELTPAMHELGEVARRGAPAVRETRAAAPALDGTLRALEPFSDAARPALKTLSATAGRSRPALAAAAPIVRQLGSTATGGPELFTNLAVLAEHLDDRDNAIEPHAESPGGRGFTALEGLLRYVRAQTLNVNIYDGNAHLLKQMLIEDPDCVDYVDLEHVKEQKQKCFTALGPRQVGVNSTDPTRTADEPAARRRAKRTARTPRGVAPAPLADAPRTETPLPPLSAAPNVPATPAPPPLPSVPSLPAVPDDATEDIESVLDLLLGP